MPKRLQTPSSSGSIPRVPSYCRHKASGQAYVKIRGRTIYLGVYDSPASRDAYAEIVHGLLTGREHAVPQRGAERLITKVTVAEVCRRYTRHAEAVYRKDGEPNAEAGMVASVLRDTAALFSDQPAETFGPVALKVVRERLIARGLARSTINASANRIRRAFKWAAAEESIPATVPQALATVEGLRAGRSAARETAPVRPVDDSDVEATIACLPPVVADMVRLQRLTGMRPGEVCAMRPRDVDRSGDIWAYRPASHKTRHRGKDRVIPLGPQAQRILAPYVLREPDACCFQPRDSESKRRAAAHAARATPLGQGNRPGGNRRSSALRAPGARYNKDTYARAIRRAAVAAGIEPWSLNRLRHAFATEVRAKYGLEAAQVLLGHATMKTSEIYAEKRDAAGYELARAIG